MRRIVATLTLFAILSTAPSAFAQSGWQATWPSVPEVEAAVAALRPGLHECYTAHVPAASREHGDIVTVRVVVSPAASVFRVDFLEGSTRSADLQRCVREAFAGLNLPTPPQTKMTFVQRIGFQNGLDKLQLETPRAAGGAITRESVDALARANQAAIQACYTAELPRSPGLRGQVLVEIVVDGRTGQVTSARIAKSTLGNAAVEACVLERTRQFEFPVPDDPGLVILQFPLSFDAG